MRRLSVLLSMFTAVLVGFLMLGRQSAVRAQDVTPGAMTGHDVVGAWVLDGDANDPNNSPAVVVFNRDGTYQESDADGSDGYGAWEATGEQTADLTIIFHNEENGQFGGTAKVRAMIEVDASGDRFTASYTLELIGPDGSGSGELGPAQATGTRITVEPMGTPVGPIPVEPEGTPAA